MNPQSAIRSPQSDGDVLVRVEGVSKKFCRDLKRSLWYGVKDVAAELNPIKSRSGQSTARNPKDSAPASHLRPGEFWAINDLSLEVRRGECLGLIGRNGAGKTTLLKMLNGLIKPDKGRIEMRGRVGALIALGAGFNPILTGRENIYVNGSVLGLKKREIDAKLDEIIEFAEIGEFIDAPVQSYSSGMQVRLGFAVASALQPTILLLDEVLAVGDVAFQAKCFNKLAAMRRDGVPFILVSHNMHQITRYCHKVVFMKQGRIVFIGDAEEAITIYLSDLQTQGADKSTGPNWGVVNGNGKVVFTGARFLNSDGAVITKIKAGSPLLFEVSYECGMPPIVDPVYDVVIRCGGECVFQSTNRLSNCEFGVLSSSGKLELRFASLALNNGPLDFYFCLLDGVTREIFDWKRDLRLEVEPDTSQSGSCRLNTEWSVAAT